MPNKFKTTVKENKIDFIKFTVFAIIIIAIIAITIKLIPWIISLKDESTRIALEEYIHSKGIYGVLFFIGLQIAQVVIAFIPGEPLEVLAGMLYGTFGGYLVCIVGILIGTIIIYYTVKWLGISSINKLLGKDKLEKYKFLNDTKKLEAIVFLLFFIPGTPKDFLTYFMPITKIKPMTFFIIVVIARIPSIVSSTFAGSSISDGKWTQTIIIFVVIGIISLLGIIFNDKIMKKFNQTKEKMKNRNNK